MHALVALVVALPLISAAAIAGLGHHVPRRVGELVGILTAAAVTAMSLRLLIATQSSDVVYWFGGWKPDGHVALGIAFVVDPFAATLAALAGALMLAAFVFSWRLFDEVRHLYYSMMLAFLGGLIGFAFAADIFDLFVWFELMGVCGFALCGYRITQPSVLQGAINFAVINSIGAFTVMMGIAVIYARTGALNLAQIAHTLDGAPRNAAVALSFGLLVTGFLVKAGAVPFHFWLSDAYAVAPAPVSVLFCGVMSDLAYHTIAKIYWHGYAGAFASSAGAVRAVLLSIGVASALVGAVMCVLQSDLKRMVAFLTVSQGGIFLAGIGLLNARGLAGSTSYLVADGLLKGGLFLAIGIAVHYLGASDELLLFGRGRRRHHAPVGVVFVVCGLGLAVLPFTGTFAGRGLITAGAQDAGLPWLSPLLAVATALTGGAVLRATARIFLGWGSQDDVLLTEEPDEPVEGEPEAASTPPEVMLVAPAAALAVVGIALSAAPHLGAYAVDAARRFVDHHGYVAEVLGGKPPAPLTALHGSALPVAAYTTAAASVAGALLLAVLMLWWQRVRGLATAVRRAMPAVRGLKAVHSGALGEYATWFAFGLAAIGTAWIITLR